MFDIARLEIAGSVAEAVRLLAENPQARLIAGGSDILLKIREGELPEAVLVSIHGLAELRQMALRDDGTLVIGAGNSFAAVAAHPLVRRYVPILAEAADTVGSPQIRHVGTIGGNICNGMPSADTAPALFALNAGLIIQGPAGTRQAGIRDFYRGPGQVNLRHDEVLTAIQITAENYREFGGRYIKFAMRNAADIATLGCAALCRVSDRTVIRDLQLAFAVAAPTPVRCPNTEALAAGQRLDADLLQRIGEAAAAEVQPRTSWRASREYRLQLVKELSRRAVYQAFLQAGGETK